MPRVIDHSERRVLLAEAVWRVAARDGIAAVSIRTVAVEAGLSAGSLRHVSPSKTELLVTAMSVAVERATARYLERSAAPLRTAGDAVQLLSEFLPLDEERHREFRTQLALTVEAVTSEELAQVRAALDIAMGTACRDVLLRCVDAGLLPAGLSTTDEALRVHALLDGLALHLMDPRPAVTADQAEKVLSRHMSSLVGEWTGS